MHFQATSRALLSAARAHLVILFEMKPAESLKEAGLSLEHLAVIRTKVFSFQLQCVFQNAHLTASRKGAQCAVLPEGLCLSLSCLSHSKFFFMHMAIEQRQS